MSLGILLEKMWPFSGMSGTMPPCLTSLSPSYLSTKKRPLTASSGLSSVRPCKPWASVTFVNWVNLFYCNVRSSVNVNGYLSQPFSLSRGVRQGCPLSPLLYVLVSKVLAVNIRANPRIRGLSLPGIQDPLPPISQYAVQQPQFSHRDRTLFKTVQETCRKNLPNL